MKRLVILGSILLVSTISLCQIPNMTQQKAVDSLFAKLPNAQGTNKVDVLNLLAIQLAPRTFDSSFRYASEALRLAGKMNYTYGKGIAIFNIGNSYYFKADIKNALTNYLTALRLLEPFEPTREVGDLLFMIGSINEFVRNTEKMLNNYYRAARNYCIIGDTSTAMLVYLTLSSSFYYKFQSMIQTDSLTPAEADVMMDSAIKYNDIVLRYYLIPHTNYKWMSVECWLVNIYNLFGCYYQIKNDSLTLNYYHKALEKSKEIQNIDSRNFLEGLMYANLSDLYYFQLKNTEKGYEYAKIAIELLKKTKRYDMYALSLSILGQIYLDKRNFKDSEKYLLKALSISDTFLLNVDRIEEPDPSFRLWGVTQLRSMRLIMFASLVKLYELKGDFRNALFYQKTLEEEKNIQTRDELTRQVIVLQANFEDELKRKEIAGLVRDNELSHLKFDRTRILFTGIGGLLVISLLIIVLWIQRKRFRSERKALTLEQKLLRAQMNPHFIFNSLYSIQNFIVTEKPDKASIYLSKFARLVRNILDNSTQEFVALEKEISAIENYLELQQVRYAGKFDYRIHIADEIDTEIMMIPPMLAQPFIENAIEHGIKHRETAGHINICFSLKDQTLIFEVEDNGVGRQKASELETAQEPGHRSMATSLTHERLKNLNRKHRKKIFLDIQDLKNDLGDAAGTKVTFGIPV
jgi:tetratricopeptide (TPR) repeat protein